jgi:hypothetical protein
MESFDRIDSAQSSTVPAKQGLNHRAVIMAMILFTLIILGMFTFAYLKNQERQQSIPTPAPAEVIEAPVADRYSNITRIDGKYFFIDGMHTVAGEILMPTPCDLLDTGAVIAESFPEQITLDFSVINNAKTCIQVTTPARFKIEAQASERATFSARFQNRKVELNLTEALPDETPDDFELFIKG